MRIKQVCNACNLTKKAIEYYKQQDLIHPQSDENGYREFSKDDVARLKEVSLLRELGIGTREIRHILDSGDKTGELRRFRLHMQIEAEKAQARMDCLDSLLNDYNVERALDELGAHTDASVTIRQKLLDAFPGSFGMYLCVHFGAFLNEPIQTGEQKIAFGRIIAFLDSVESVPMPDALEESLSLAFADLQEDEMRGMHDALLRAADDADRYFEEHKDAIASYLEYRREEDEQSPVAVLRKSLVDFQQQTGYCEVFLPNLKILSASYREYTEKLEQANDALRRRFPEAADAFKHP